MKVLWYVPAILALALLVVGPLLAHTGALPAFTGFLLFAASLLPAILALVFGVVLALKGQRGPATASLVVGLIPLAVVGSGLAKGRNFPRINDISTNLDNPPQLVAAASAPENAGKDLTYPSDFKTPVQDAYPDLISLQLAMPPADAFALVEKVARGMPDWTVTRVDAATLTLEGSETSGLFQFTDDFVVRVLPLDGSAQVDMRSRSRVGKGDFGANAARIRRFFEAVDAAAKPAS